MPTHGSKVRLGESAITSHVDVIDVEDDVLEAVVGEL
jgi:hypothetical protein